MHILTYVLYSLLALFVAYLWLSYLRLIDVFQPETWKRLLITFGLGCLSVLPVMGIHWLFPNVFIHPTTANGQLFYFIFNVGLLEEISKLTFAIIALQFFIKDKEPVDYVVHAAVAALGFATVENVLYLNQYGAEIIRGRAGFSALGHMTDTAIPMYFYIRSKMFGGKNSEPLLHMVGGLLLASVLHGLYDFFLMLGSIYVFLMLVVYLISIELWLTFINNMLNISPHFKKNKVPDYSKIQRLLLVGFLALSAIEFIYTWYMHDWESGHWVQLIRIPVAAVFLVLLVMSKLSKLRLIPNKQFPIFTQIPFAFNAKTFTPNAESGNFSSARHNVRVDSINEIEITKHVYTEIKLVPREGSNAGITGRLIDKIWGDEDESFFIFEPQNKVHFRDYRSDIWIIKAQTTGNIFYKDEFSEVMVFLVPLGAEVNQKSKVAHLGAYGRHYIIPKKTEVVLQII